MGCQEGFFLFFSFTSADIKKELVAKVKDGMFLEELFSKAHSLIF
jgi:hypothetical protein